MYNAEYWLGYDDEESLMHKVRYANLRGFAGIMVWTIDTDDFRPTTENGGAVYPLLNRYDTKFRPDLSGE